MNRKTFIQHWVSVALMAAAALSLAASLFSDTGRSDVESAALEMGQKVERRMHVLDGYIEKALEGDLTQWMDLGKLPEDMVVYRYVDDTLQSWANQFPIRNDDIRPQTLVQRLGDNRSNLISPLRDVTGQLSFVNHGSRWFLEKKVEGKAAS